MDIGDLSAPLGHECPRKLKPSNGENEREIKNELMSMSRETQTVTGPILDLQGDSGHSH